MNSNLHTNTIYTIIIMLFLGVPRLWRGGLYAHTPPLSLRSVCGVSAAIPNATAIKIIDGLWLF